MTEQEAIEILNNFDKQVSEKADSAYQSTIGEMACKVAVKALEEIQQYRAIGTAEEIRRMQKYSVLAKKHDTIGKAIEACAEYEQIGTVDRFRQLSQQFAPHVTGPDSCKMRMCNKCDKYRRENEKYHAVGTVEECREAREKQKAKEPIEFSPCRSVSYYKCPVCNEILVIGKDFCCNCGQHLDWSEDD